MIGIVCAMEEELKALTKLMEDVKIEKGKTLSYHDRTLEISYYIGSLRGSSVVATQCGVGKVFAALGTQLLIQNYQPELILNIGVAGSLNENIHVNDIVVADRIADWEVDVPGWERSMNGPKVSYACSSKVLRVFKKIRRKSIKIGSVVSGDEFIYKKSQLRTIKKYFPEAYAGEMEGFAIATACDAYGVECGIIRSISDETLVGGNYEMYDFNLLKVCDTVALLCSEIIGRLA